VEQQVSTSFYTPPNGRIGKTGVFSKAEGKAAGGVLAAFLVGA
jgi:hypothetical protein